MLIYAPLQPNPCSLAARLQNKFANCAQKFVRLAEMNVKNMTMTTVKDVRKPVFDVQKNAGKWSLNKGKEFPFAKPEQLLKFAQKGISVCRMLLGNCFFKTSK